jgi:DeoR/GlpR family transcriptional regulator of sugar metabolism
MAKRAIGRAAAALLEQGDSAIIDVGTTTVELARALRGRHGLTIVTPSLPVAFELGEERGIRVLITGGTLRPGELSLVGARAEEAFGDLNCDIAFIGVAGLTADAGLTEYSLDDTRVKRAAIRRARRVAVLADHSKLGRVALATICPLDDIDVLVTDASPSHPVCLAAREASVEVIHVTEAQ